MSEKPADPTTGELLDALAAFVMALSWHLPEDVVDRISADLLASTERMRADGFDNAATLASALAAAMHVPFRLERGGNN